MSDVSSISASGGLVDRHYSTSKASSSAKTGMGESGKTSPPSVSSPRPEELGKQGLEEQAQMRERLQSAVAQMNEYVQSTQRDLQFSYDEELGDTIVRVLDRSTQEVIRQIP